MISDIRTCVVDKRDLLNTDVPYSEEWMFPVCVHVPYQIKVSSVHWRISHESRLLKTTHRVRLASLLSHNYHT